MYTPHRIDLHEDAIVDNTMSKLRRVLPLTSLIGICKDVPTDFVGSIQEVVSLPVLGKSPLMLHCHELFFSLIICVVHHVVFVGDLYMHLRRSLLTETQVCLAT